MRRTLLSAPLAAVAFAAAGCASVQSAPRPPVMPGADLPEPCRPFVGDEVRMRVNAEVARPGDTAPIQAIVRRPYHPGYETVPATCLSDWRITPAGAATVARDEGPRATGFRDVARVTFAPDLAAGTTVTIEARTPGQPARADVTIAGRDEALLVGRYSQLEVTCEGPAPQQPVRELRFRREGHFSVTWAPFETYEDYWGDYVHDPETGRMTLTVTGGNHLPGGGARLGGTVELKPDEGRLVMDGFYLGDGKSDGADQSCRYVFSGPSLQ